MRRPCATSETRRPSRRAPKIYIKRAYCIEAAVHAHRAVAQPHGPAQPRPAAALPPQTWLFKNVISVRSRHGRAIHATLLLSRRAASPWAGSSAPGRASPVFARDLRRVPRPGPAAQPTREPSSSLKPPLRAADNPSSHHHLALAATRQSSPRSTFLHVSTGPVFCLPRGSMISETLCCTCTSLLRARPTCAWTAFSACRGPRRAHVEQRLFQHLEARARGAVVSGRHLVGCPFLLSSVAVLDVGRVLEGRTGLLGTTRGAWPVFRALRSAFERRRFRSTRCAAAVPPPLPPLQLAAAATSAAASAACRRRSCVAPTPPRSS